MIKNVLCMRISKNDKKVLTNNNSDSIMPLSKEEKIMKILIGALFLSIWHSILFWNQGIGISAVLFAIPVIYITVKLLKEKTERPKALLISIPIILLSSTYFICGINEIMGGTLKGMGKPIVPMFATMIFMCAIGFVWVYLIFPLCPNLTFLYLIWPIGWILSIATLLVVYFRAMSKLQNKMQIVTDI